MEDNGAYPQKQPRRVRKRVRSEGLKRFADLVGGALLLLLAILLAPVIALCVLVESPGAVIFRQERLGRGGLPFTLWKFRTMRTDAHVAPAPERKGRHDPRVTRVGRWLRRSSLDELPQAWNILRGEMSLVGPRPLGREETEDLGSQAWERLAVRPGLTGLWQVSGRSDLPPERMLELDILYAARCSLWSDAWILLRTIPAVLTRRGAY